jgi:hypothetical protein
MGSRAATLARSDAWDRILNRWAADEGPNAALRALFDGELSGDDP